ncbi:MAG TPA: hypothetical protein PLJ25_02845 [Methanothrix sp.]|nr:hypothetical protein [Methanothrix sp.]
MHPVSGVIALQVFLVFFDSLGAGQSWEKLWLLPAGFWLWGGAFIERSCGRGSEPSPSSRVATISGKAALMCRQIPR